MIVTCEICLKQFETDKTRVYCEECSPPILEGVNQHKIDIRRRFKNEIVDIYGGECQACKIKVHQSAYDFHHVDESKKKFQLSSPTTRSWESFLKEATKCVMLCKNCHALHHAGVLGKDITEKDIPKEVFERLEKVKEIKRLRPIKQAKKVENLCIDCGAPLVDAASERCWECYNLNGRPNKGRPDNKKELSTKVKELGFSGAGRYYKVTPNTIRDWCEWHGMSRYIKDYKN